MSNASYCDISEESSKGMSISTFLKEFSVANYTGVFYIFSMLLLQCVCKLYIIKQNKLTLFTIDQVSALKSCPL